MPKRKIQLANNEIYHIVIRGIDGRDIFIDEADYYRAIHNLFEFNDSKPASPLYRQHYESRNRSGEDGGGEMGGKERDLIVDVLAFCLMPNHIHLLLRQIRDGCISKFMNKFGSGYVNYFNKKYERNGYLFQSRFKAVRIKTNSQLKCTFVYIHTNPASLIDSSWKDGGIKNPQRIIKFIESYKWSSYSGYLGKENFPQITQRDLFGQMMSKNQWRKFVNEWIEYKNIANWDSGVELE